MKRIIFIAVVLLFTVSSQAQKDTTFYRHEVRASVGEGLSFSVLSFSFDVLCPVNISFAYFYRPVKWFWIGGNFTNYFGKINYDWREYDIDGNYSDFEISKIKYCGIIAPEIRFSYLNNKYVILYSALSVGVGYESGDSNSKYDEYKHSRIRTCPHVTFFGVSCNLGENKNIFIGGEVGIGYKGVIGGHFGYRF